MADQKAIDAIRDALKEYYTEQFNTVVVPLLNGAVADIEVYLSAIAKDATEAAMVGDMESRRLLANQLSVLAEKHRIIMANSALHTILSVIDVGIAIVPKVLGAIP